MKLLRLAAGCWITATIMTTGAWAQPRLQFGQPVDFGISGFHIYNVTGAMEYTSVAGPVSANTTNTGLGGDYVGFASVSAGYSKANANESFSITYTPGYVAHVRYSDLHYLNQDLRILGNRRLNSAWNAYGTLEGGDATLENFLFSSAPVGGLNAGDATGALAGPAAAILYGTRVLTATAVAGLTYRPTSRFRVAFGARATLAQALRNDFLPANAVVARNVYVGGDITMGYSLAPRTEIGVNEATTRNTSRYGEYTTSSVLTFLYHRFSPRWSGSVGAGPAFTGYLTGPTVTTLHNVNAVSYTALANVGYDRGTNRLTAGYGRAAGDAYGLGVGASNSIEGSWELRILQSGWTAKAAGGQTRFTGGAFGGLTENHATGSITRYLGQHWSTGLDYTYVQYSGSIVTKAFDDHIAKISVIWVPFVRDAVYARAARTPQVNPGDPIAPPAP